MDDLLSLLGGRDGGKLLTLGFRLLFGDRDIAFFRHAARSDRIAGFRSHLRGGWAGKAGKGAWRNRTSQFGFRALAKADGLIDLNLLRFQRTGGRASTDRRARPRARSR